MRRTDQAKQEYEQRSVRQQYAHVELSWCIHAGFMLRLDTDHMDSEMLNHG